jgi:hypothetical protein
MVWRLKSMTGKEDTCCESMRAACAIPGSFQIVIRKIAKRITHDPGSQ